MIKLLSRIFIKNHDDTMNPLVREKYGMLCGALGICLNVLLFSAKLLTGIISKSVAITADAFNNLSDAAASLVSIIGFKLSGKRPDKDHPFGHGRIEYVAGLIVSFLILMMGVELMRTSVAAVFNPKQINGSTVTIIVLVVSISVKMYMYLYNHQVAKKICSATMEATAKDSLNDTVSTAAVLLVVVVTRIFPNINIPLDGIAGILVALFILYGGYESLLDTINPLLGVPADKEFVRNVEQTVLTHKPICGIHDLIVHDYGPGRLIISLHAEVPGNHDIFELHNVIDNAEKDISQKFNCLATIHMDPLDTQNPELEIIKTYLDSTICQLGEGFSVHDIRIVPGSKNLSEGFHTNVIFDVVKPHECKMHDNEIRHIFSRELTKYNKQYNTVIQIDSPFIQ